MDKRRLRIALLTHSTNPRGGVVHCLALAEALCRLGHEAVVHAPARQGQTFFREATCGLQLLPEQAHAGTLLQRIEHRIKTFEAWFAQSANSAFDVFHAHDGIGANALANLASQGRIAGYLRTVHHVDSYGDKRVDELEARSIRNADRVLCVSPTWINALQERMGIAGELVSNGVDTQRFSPNKCAIDEQVRTRLGLNGRPVFLSVGGIEARKNTVRLLAAFAKLKRDLPHAQLLIAGGASFLDHDEYRQEFDQVQKQAGLTVGQGGDVVLAGVLPDQEMPAIYRAADCLIFPSLLEGFGLAILEAMACGLPTVVSHIPPFTDFLGEHDCCWVNPLDPDSIAKGMIQALMPATRTRLLQSARKVVERFDWASSARRHADIYFSTIHNFIS